MDTGRFFIYLAVMAVVTYLVRAVPFVLINRKLTNRYLRAFFNYIPYAVLASMTIPEVFYSTDSVVTATAGFVVALVLAFMKKSLLTVALSASAAVLISSLLLSL